MAVANADNDYLIANNIEDDDVGTCPVYAHWPVELFTEPHSLRKVADKAQRLSNLLHISSGLRLTEQPHALIENPAQVVFSGRRKTKDHPCVLPRISDMI